MDQLLELAPDRVGARRQQLRHEQHRHVLDRVHGEGRAGRATPPEVADGPGHLRRDRVEGDRHAEPEPDPVVGGLGEQGPPEGRQVGIPGRWLLAMYRTVRGDRSGRRRARHRGAASRRIGGSRPWSTPGHRRRARPTVGAAPPGRRRRVGRRHPCRGARRRARRPDRDPARAPRSRCRPCQRFEDPRPDELVERHPGRHLDHAAEYVRGHRVRPLGAGLEQHGSSAARRSQMLARSSVWGTPHSNPALR